MDKDTNPSFFVDHTKLQHGLYKSKVDWVGCPSIAGGMNPIVTYDLRFKTPYREKAMSVKSMHAIEHMMAVATREVPFIAKVLYFGMMGCSTGCYMMLDRDCSILDVKMFLEVCIQKCLNMESIPAQSKRECGNYTLMDLDEARKDLESYLNVLENLTPEQMEYQYL